MIIKLKDMKKHNIVGKQDEKKIKELRKKSCLRLKQSCRKEYSLKEEKQRNWLKKMKHYLNRKKFTQISRMKLKKKQNKLKLYSTKLRKQNSSIMK